VTELRDYQREAVEAVYAGWDRGLHAPGVSLPTGVGKTVIMCEIARRLADAGLRVLVLLHRDQLVEQTVGRMREHLTRGTSVGVVKAGRNEVGARVIIASVHTLRTAGRRTMLPPIDAVIVDEAHVSVSPTYLACYAHLRVGEPGGARLVGFSATWSRSDGAGLGDVWQEIVFQRSIKWALQQNPPILVRPRGIQVGAGIDLSDVRVKGRDGDYRDDDLARAVMLEDLRDTVVRAAQRFGAGRPGALFAPTVAAAEYFADGLRQAGIGTAGIYHNTSPSERRRRFRDNLPGGPVQILTTCTALAVGWDSPHSTVGYLLRPTKFAGMFVQTAGRFLRPAPGKTEALLLDFVGLLDDLSLRAEVDLRESPPRVDAETGELLALEAELDEEQEDTERDAVIVQQRSRSREVELFAASAVAWQATTDGMPFVSCGERLVFLVAVPGGWSVGECLSYTTQGGRFIGERMSADAALDLASEHAEALAGKIAKRSARWRKEAPSDAQRNLARQYGIDPAGMRRGELSAAIDQQVASVTLKPMAEWSVSEMSREAVST
jgi:superfamily II DNA or RNA helicase